MEGTSRFVAAFIFVMTSGVVACVSTRAPAPAAQNASPAPLSVSSPPGARGFVLPPAEGERYVYCSRPLTLWIHLDSVSSPTTQMVAGSGVIRGDEGTGRHARRHEVVYIRSGWGYAVFGSDTTQLGPGSVLYVPPGTRHRFVRTGAQPLEYFWVIGPMHSAQGFRDAAQLGCPGQPPVPSPTTSPADSLPGLVRVLDPGEGERIAYCDIPLVITAKVDSETVAGTWLRAATGVLRTGSEAGVHAVDEVVLITHGSGKAFFGSDTVGVQAGSVVHVPRGMQHGFINEGVGTLEYFIVYAGTGSRAAFRRRAARPGPYCP